MACISTMHRARQSNFFPVSIVEKQTIEYLFSCVRVHLFVCSFFIYNLILYEIMFGGFPICEARDFDFTVRKALELN